MMGFAALRELTIPEGVVTQIEIGGVVLWMANDGSVYDVTISENAAGGLTYTITAVRFTAAEDLSGGLTYTIGG